MHQVEGQVTGIHDDDDIITVPNTPPQHAYDLRKNEGNDNNNNILFGILIVTKSLICSRTPISNIWNWEDKNTDIIVLLLQSESVQQGFLSQIKYKTMRPFHLIYHNDDDDDDDTIAVTQLVVLFRVKEQVVLYCYQVKNVWYDNNNSIDSTLIHPFDLLYHDDDIIIILSFTTFCCSIRDSYPYSTCCCYCWCCYKWGGVGRRRVRWINNQYKELVDVILYFTYCIIIIFGVVYHVIVTVTVTVTVIVVVDECKSRIHILLVVVVVVVVIVLFILYYYYYYYYSLFLFLWYNYYCYYLLL